jgi:CheY-like chemotaxis protein
METSKTCAPAVPEEETFFDDIHDEFDLSFKVYYELMAKRVSEILLVSSPYDAFTMEEDGRLAERIIHEYRGLNLTRPPRLTWASTAREALAKLSSSRFDLVITMPRLNDMEPYELGREIKQNYCNTPVFLMLHGSGNLLTDERYSDRSVIDKIYVWQGNTDLLLAVIKNVEDGMNVGYDTNRAKVRVVIMVEDSPLYRSSLLPALYKEIVTQTQAVMEESLNEEHRILRMRARPKILVAENYEEAEALYRKYLPYLIGMISDVRFPKAGVLETKAGFSFLSMIKKESPDIPLLMISSEEDNRPAAALIPAVFLNKNSPSLHSEIRSFFVNYLGFGDFVFRLPDGKEIARVQTLREMEKILPGIPDESVFHHASRNHFSTWLMARSEILLASKLKPVKVTDFNNMSELKTYLAACINRRRKGRQKGVVTDFDQGKSDPEAEFIKIGKGSLGGKARGLAFFSTLLEENRDIAKKYTGVTIKVPKSVVISTEGFDSFMNRNNLKYLATADLSDADITDAVMKADFPEDLRRDLGLFASQADYPLAVRSSSLLEDAQFQPFAGIYKTYMIPNNHPEIPQRLELLIQAVKLVYASTYLETPRSYAKSTMHRMEEEKMAVIIQQLTGSRHKDYFYPAISGVAQSHNFYPVAQMKPEEGIASIALGLGKIVVEGGTVLRFSPRYPQLLSQFSNMESILKNSQRYFYALNMTTTCYDPGSCDDVNLIKIETDEASDHPLVGMVSSAFMPEENRIRDSFTPGGYPVVTFADILKYGSFPLPEILTEILEIVRIGMGCPVEIEFAVNLPVAKDQKPEFCVLQIRPMSVGRSGAIVELDTDGITTEEMLCRSSSALGNGIFTDMSDIIFVDPETFDPAFTEKAASEIGKINRKLFRENRRYLLIGPGRWGSFDRWLGIPVSWNDISGVGAIIETSGEKLKADPSQGSHFFHNITSLGISYITVHDNGKSFLDLKWLKSMPAETETPALKHIRLDKPLVLKIDGGKSCAVILK